MFELSTRELNAKFYYHGTSKWYFYRQVSEHGRYQHDHSKICIAPDNYDLCANYACDRTMCLAHQPIVLKVAGDKIRSRIYSCPTEHVPIIDFLMPKEVEILNVDIKRYLDWAKKHKY